MDHNSKDEYRRHRHHKDIAISADKVFDWVYLRSLFNRRFTAEDIRGLVGDPGFNVCDPVVDDLEVRCYLSDADRNPLPLNTNVAAESSERVDRDFYIEGKRVTLQRVSLVKSFFLVIEFSFLQASTRRVVSTPAIPITIPESVYLCAPDGTEVVALLADYDCNVQVICTGAAGTTFGGVDVMIELCQSIQSLANVVIEVDADILEAREAIDAVCPPMGGPVPCKNIFPKRRRRHHDHDHDHGYDNDHGHDHDHHNCD
jgi:hypothetical protein